MKKKSKLSKIKTILQIIFLILLILSALPALFGKAAAAEYPIATQDNADLIPDMIVSDDSDIDNIFNADLYYKIDNNLPDKYADQSKYFFGFGYEISFLNWFDVSVSDGTFAEISSSDPALAAMYVSIYNDCKRNIYIGVGLLIGFTALLCVPICKFLKF